MTLPRMEPLPVAMELTLDRWYSGLLKHFTLQIAKATETTTVATLFSALLPNRHCETDNWTTESSGRLCCLMISSIATVVTCSPYFLHLLLSLKFHKMHYTICATQLQLAACDNKTGFGFVIRKVPLPLTRYFFPSDNVFPLFSPALTLQATQRGLR